MSLKKNYFYPEVIDTFSMRIAYDLLKLNQNT